MSDKPRTLMVQGTTSDAGKSTLVAGLGRMLLRRGVKVAPFKPQNMALNSAVTPDGGEIGRAQAVQAQACGVETSVHMNPILIKPNSDTGAQIIVQGKPVGNFEATGFHEYKKTAMAAVLDSYAKLQQQYSTILVEGAGSPAEINLREGDIANMGFAEEVDCPVVLVTDIDRGGSFAHLVGTLELLSDTEKARVKGFYINRFRGDIKLLLPGVEWLEKRTGVPVLGVVPYIKAFHLEAEDAINSEQYTADVQITVCVPVFPRISNHTDFDPLRLHPNVNLQYVAPEGIIPPCDLIILPGSKSVRQDLQHLKEQGWDVAIKKHLRYGGKVLGICGGYQMLGQSISDPLGVEGQVGESDGLALLDCTTVLTQAKALRRVSGKLKCNDASVHGYEIHMGVTSNSPDLQAFAQIENAEGLSVDDGICSADDQIRASYIHGLFDSQESLAAILKWAGASNLVSEFDYETLREKELDRLADTLEACTDMAALASIVCIDP